MPVTRATETVTSSSLPLVTLLSVTSNSVSLTASFLSFAAVAFSASVVFSPPFWLETNAFSATFRLTVPLMYACIFSHGAPLTFSISTMSYRITNIRSTSAMKVDPEVPAITYSNKRVFD